MNSRTLLAVAAALFASTAVVSAEPDKGLSGQIMDNHPGTRGSGTTNNPTARPDKEKSGSISAKEMKDHPGTKTGTTKNPTADPDGNSIEGKVMKDHPGVEK